MGNVIRVDTDRLETDAEKILACIRQINELIDALAVNCDGQDEMWDKDIRDLREISDGLLMLHRFEVCAADSFEACVSMVDAVIDAI